jgi:AcrR family transcriptional regulator
MTHHDRSEEIVARAVELAQERGVAGITTAILARRMGFTEAALYRYFPGKAAILGACLDQLAGALFTSMVGELDPHAAGDNGAVVAQLELHVNHFTGHDGLLLDLVVAAAAARDGGALQEAADAFLNEYSHRIGAYFRQLQQAARVSRAVSPDDWTRLWTCQLFGGFLRTRIAKEDWQPATQPGFTAFVARVRQADRHEAVSADG